MPKGRGAGPEGRWVANPCFRKRSNETMHCDKVWVRVRTVCVMPDSLLKDLCSTLGLQQRETPSSPHDVLVRLGVWFLHPSIKRGLEKSQDTPCFGYSRSDGLFSPYSLLQSLHDLVPPYLCDLMTPYSPSCSSRSSNDNLLSIPRTS